MIGLKIVSGIQWLIGRLPGIDPPEKLLLAQQIGGCIPGTPLHITSVFAQYILLFIMPFMTIAYVIALMRKDNSVADIAWGLGFIGIAWIAWGDGYYAGVSLLLAVLITLWGTRLAWHVFTRNRGKPEDFRYKEWRKKWGTSATWKSFTHVFLLQGIVMAIIALPVIVASITGRYVPIGILHMLGATVWTCGFLIETTADAQLRAFKKAKGHKGKVMDSGLWRYSRHPNYFGESVMWWGIWIIALSATYGWATVVSPLLITFLLTKVSGIPLLEKKYKDSPAYQAYAQRTSAFVPWFPRSVKKPASRRRRAG